MIGLVIFGCYVAAGLLTARKVAYAVIASDDDQEERWFAAFLGLIVGIVWPAAFVVMLFARSIPKTPTELKLQAKEAEARAEAAEEIVRQFAIEHGEDGKRGIIRFGDDEWRF